MAKNNTLKILQGNEACVEGAILAGIRFFAGYPITPASEISEGMALRLPELGGTFMQMEDEIASMAAIIGASLTGVKAMTASSGPGICLKQENIGFATIAEVPCVIVNAQRGGPSTGLPTKPSQGDVMQARWGTHGDHPMIALAPSDVNEILYTTIKAVNLSEKYRTPVTLLLDEVIAHMREKVYVPDPEEIELINRKKPAMNKEQYIPYKAEEDLIPAMADFGSGYRYHVTGLIHNEKGYPTSNNREIDQLIRRLTNKVELNKEKIIIKENIFLDDANIAIIAYGSVARAAQKTVKLAREKGIKVGLLKLTTLWPFDDRAINQLARNVKFIIVAEMNLGQIAREVERAAHGKCPIIPYNRVDGELIDPWEILFRIEEELKP